MITIIKRRNDQDGRMQDLVRCRALVCKTEETIKINAVDFMLQKGKREMKRQVVVRDRFHQLFYTWCCSFVIVRVNLMHLF